MARKIIIGTVASQPVVISMPANIATVMLVVKTECGYKKFFCTVERSLSEVVTLIDTMFANVALSSIGDQVEVEVKDCDSPIYGARLLSFVNQTKVFEMP